MKDVRLIVYGVGETFDSEIIKMSELPKVGEHISTIYFKKYEKLEHNKVFQVARIVHHYVDDMSSIDYTEVELERSNYIR
jgi:hypothetical protein